MKKNLLNDQGLVHFVKRYLFFTVLFSMVNTWGQVSITSLPQTYNQDFNGLSTTATTFTNNSTLTGWYISSSTLAVSDGSANGNSCYNYGTSSATDRSIGALSTSTTHNFGVRIKNNSSAAIAALDIAFNGEQWRQNATAQTLVFEYQTSTSAITSLTAGTWIAAPTFDYTGTNIGTAGPLDGNLPANRAAKSGTLTVSIPAGSEIFLRWTKSGTSSSGLAIDDLSITARSAGITSANSGNWADGSTWVGGVAPTSAQNVIIAAGHTVTLASAVTRNSGTTTTVTGTLAAAATYTNNGTTTVNGTFQLNAGGYADGTTNLTYGTTSTLAFNHSPNGVYGVNGGSYWPSTNGPVNVTLNANSPVNLGFARTVTGVFATSAALTGASNLTVNGTNQINSTSASFDSAVNYGAASTLVYNSGSTFNRGNEWNNNPNNVTLQNSTTLNYPNGWGNITRTLNGNLTVGSGSALYMDYGSPGTGVGALTVKGNVLGNGNISLGNQSGGDLVIGGNFTNTATFNANGRKVTFNGTTAQSITGATTFAYLEYNSSAGSNVLTINNDITVNNELRFTTGLVSLASGVNLNIANNSSIVSTSGNFNSASTSGTVNFLGTASTAGTINFYPAVAQSPSSVLGVSYSIGSTIQNTLTLNSNSYVTSAPKYATGSTLIYNNTGTYARGVEWGSVGTTFPANGYPHHVTVQNGTALNIETGLTGTLRANGNLNLGIAASAGSLNMQNTGNAVEIKGNVNLGNTTGTSTLTLSTNVGGDISVGGNWVRNTTNGVLVSNNRAVAFNGTSAQALTGTTTFDYLTINNSAGLTLNNAVSVNQTLNLTSGKITLGANDLTIAASGSISGGTTSNYIVTNSTGALKWLAVGNADKTFPVGKDTTYYAPLTIRNTTGTADMSVRVNGSITNAVYNASNVVTQEWLVNSSSATTATITPVWAGAKQGSIVNPGPGELGNYVSSYTVYPTTLVATPQNQTTATGVAVSSGNNYIVVGSTGAVYVAPPANDTCSNAATLIVNNPVTHGTLNGATKTGSSTYPDVFYKFTPSVTGTYTVTINNFSAGDRDLYIYTSCPSAVPGTVVSGYSGTTTSTTSETVTNTFTSGTTYYIAVYDYQTAKGTFDIRVTANPIITANPTSIAFGTVNLGSVVSSSFNLTADLLTVDSTSANNKITITAPTGYKVSLNNTTWFAAVDVPYTTSSLSSTPIYVIIDETVACGITSGNVTFATANLITSPTVAVTADLFIPVSTTSAGTDITATTFAANWSQVNGVSGYELDVYTLTTGIATLTNGFDAGTTAPSGWAYTGIGSTYTSATNYGQSSPSVSFDTTTDKILTPVLSGSATELKFWIKGQGTAASSDFRIRGWDSVNSQWVVIQNITNSIPTTGTTITYNASTTPALPANITQFEFYYNLKTSGNVALDDINIAYNSIVEHPVSGYYPKSIVGASTVSQLVSGLTPNTTYYYRVNAVSGSCKSSDSNVQTVLTNNTVIWTNNAWTNGAGPTSTLDAIVRDAYSTSASGNITAKDLTVENTGSVTIGNSTSVKVEGTLVINNNVAKDNFVIQTGGNLLQTSTAANNTNGIIQAQRSVTGINNDLNTAMDYVYWSSPVSGQITTGSTGFSPGTPANRFYEYNESKDTFKATTDGTFTAGKGYAVRAETGLNPDTNANYIDGYSKTYKFNGVPNNGDISVDLARTNVTGTTGLGFNLVGNPYPSNMDFRELYAANSSAIYNTAYFWTNNVFVKTQAGTNYAQNNYAVYNGTGGNAATQAAEGSGDTTVPDGLVSVGQGFIVQAKNQGTSSLSFKNSYSAGHDLRVSNNAHFFQKQSDSKNRFWIKLVSPTNLINTQLIGYVSGASNDFEQDYDTEALSTSSDVFYSVLGSKQLLIQGRSENFNSNDVIPVGANFFQSGTYKIGLDKAEGIFENGQRVYLKDKLLNKTVDLSQGDYSFTASKGLDNSRFEIVYKDNSVLGVDGLSKSEFLVYKDAGEYVIRSTKKLGKVEVYDATGRMLKSFNSTENIMRIDISDVSNGIYIVKVENSGDTKTKKIIK
ncbi:T9SS type A sorting domain-containing protein [Epilithonimonas sp.]|uniref:T9SS type A sorting domain-containing protein n=1 Tax=Epilithonimonas sp. TaxID=2894511 RepID=UPI0028A116B6|nr:T9SS type A sorting domain-containing protein [Epilithonimonas sp.]